MGGCLPRKTFTRLWGALAPVALLCTACAQEPKKPEPPAPPEPPKFELREDAQGRIVRRNLVTDEQLLVSGTRLVPVKASTIQLKPTAPASAPAGTTTPGASTGAPSAVPDGSPRYQLLQDAQKRVIRLDIMTGEVAIVAGATVTPVVVADERPRTVERREAEPPAVAPATAPRPPDLGESISITVAPRFVGPTIEVVSTSPVYLYPVPSRIPLRVLAAGSTARLLAEEGEWYRIQFEDPRWGPRFGFIEKARAMVSDSRGQSGTSPTAPLPAQSPPTPSPPPR